MLEADSFEIVLRGYDRWEVDELITAVRSALSAGGELLPEALRQLADAG